MMTRPTRTLVILCVAAALILWLIGGVLFAVPGIVGLVAGAALASTVYLDREEAASERLLDELDSADAVIDATRALIDASLKGAPLGASMSALAAALTAYDAAWDRKP